MALICSVLGVSAPEDEVALVPIGGLLVCLSIAGQRLLMEALAPNARAVLDAIETHDALVTDCAYEAIGSTQDILEVLSGTAMSDIQNGLSNELLPLETQDALNRSKANVEVAKADLISTMVKWIRAKRAEVDKAAKAAI